ncbi:MAG TPA: response regulator [Longimicrobium sp.]
MTPKFVLLVDSHEDSRAIYTAILEHYGFGVASAAHADEGLRLARARKPDLVVLEFSPPRARSLEAFRAFRRDEATASVPIVALSTMVGEADRELLVAEGITMCLAKPCPPLTLLDVAKRLLGGQ